LDTDCGSADHDHRRKARAAGSGSCWATTRSWIAEWMIVGGRGTVPVTRNAIPLCYTNAKMHTAPSWIAEWKELSLLLLTARCTASLNGVVRALPVTIAISVFSSAIFRDSTKRVVSDQACLLVGGTVPVTRNAIPSKFLHPPHRLSTATRQRSVTCNGFDRPK
jgi:hypothetical protein